MKETKTKYYFLIDLYRHFVGEDLDSLSLKELQNLEQQLDSALKHIRTRKVKSFLLINVIGVLVYPLIILLTKYINLSLPEPTYVRIDFRASEKGKLQLAHVLSSLIKWRSI